MDIAGPERRVFVLPPQSSPSNLVCYSHSDWTANNINPQSLQIFLQIGWTMVGRTIERGLLTLVFSFLEHLSLKAIKIFLKSFHLFLALSAFFLLGWRKPGRLVYWEDKVKFATKNILNFSPWIQIKLLVNVDTPDLSTESFI